MIGNFNQYVIFYIHLKKGENIMRKLLSVLTIAALPFFANANETLKVAATPVPHAEMLEFAKPLLKEKGIDLDIVVLTDYVLPNIMLNEGEVKANFMQHLPYLESFNKDNGTNSISVAKIHVEPLAGYSKKIKSIKDLPNNAKVSIPNDVTNGGRALILLQNNGIIKLEDPTNILSSISDIKENPKNITFIELEAPMLARTIDDVDLAIINTNFALDANLNPKNDALIIEGQDSPYANIIAVKPENKDDPQIKVLIEVLQSPEMKKFIEEKYQGSILPTF